MSDYTPEQRIEAAKMRLGDLKALHTRFSANGYPGHSANQVIDDMEHIAYSAMMYLDGVQGVYLKPIKKE